MLKLVKGEKGDQVWIDPARVILIQQDVDDDDGSVEEDARGPVIYMEQGYKFRADPKLTAVQLRDILFGEPNMPATPKEIWGTERATSGYYRIKPDADVTNAPSMDFNLDAVHPRPDADIVKGALEIYHAVIEVRRRHGKLAGEVRRFTELLSWEKECYYEAAKRIKEVRKWW